MAASISVVVPALNEAAGLAGFLADLLARDEGVDVTVVDGGSSDGTAEIAAGFPGVRVVRAPRGRAAQMNAGARAGRSDLLLFLHADTRLPADALPRIRAALAAPGVAAGSFRLAFDRDDLWLRLYSLCSRINLPLFTYGDQGLFLRRATFERIGGFREMPILEDLEIQVRLRRLGRFVKLAASVVTSARRFVHRGPVRQQAWNTALVLAYRLGVPPATLRRFYDDARPAAAGESRGAADAPAGLTLWDHLHGTLRLNVPQQEIVIGVPAWQDPADVTLPRIVAQPFRAQPESWRLPDGTRPGPHPETAPRTRLAE